jgi:hypothetical protein
MQFGHDNWMYCYLQPEPGEPYKGVGDSAKEIYNPITKQQEVVHTYGWVLIKSL